MAFTEYLSQALLNHVFTTSPYTVPTIYVGLLDTSHTELSGNGYARVACSGWAGSGGEVDNDANVDFPEATGAWSEAIYAAIYDASTAGNKLAEAALTAGKTIASGEVARFNAGDINITLS